jgi:hypothetical protein
VYHPRSIRVPLVYPVLPGPGSGPGPGPGAAPVTSIQASSPGHFPSKPGARPAANSSVLSVGRLAALERALRPSANDPSIVLHRTSPNANRAGCATKAGNRKLKAVSTHMYWKPCLSFLLVSLWIYVSFRIIWQYGQIRGMECVRMQKSKIKHQQIKTKH